MQRIFAIAAFCAVCLFSTLGLRTLENMDYVRYAEVGREILETGDWVVPHSLQEVYVDKPPLYFWCVALSYKLCGVNAFAARLTSALAALVLLGAVLAVTGAATGSAYAGMLSALVLLSSWGFFFYSHRTRVDVLFAAFFSLALFSFYGGILRTRRHSAPLFALFWLCTGLAFMVKGPVALLSLAAALVYWAAARRLGLARPHAKAFILTAPAALIPIAPWLYKLVGHPDFELYRQTFMNRTILKRHAGILYYFGRLPVMFAAAFLFLPAVCSSLKREWRRDRSIRPFALFLLAWCGTFFIALNLTSIKTHRYLLPMYPPLAILTGWGLSIAVRDGLYKKYLHRTGAFFYGLALIAFLAAPVVVWKAIGYHFSAFLVAAAMAATLAILWKRTAAKVLLVLTVVPLAYLYLDYAAALRNDRTSEILAAYEILMDSRVEAGDVALYKDCGDLKKIFSFYFNKSVVCSDDAGTVKQYRTVVMRADKRGEITMDGYREHLVPADHRKKSRSLALFTIQP